MSNFLQWYEELLLLSEISHWFDLSRYDWIRTGFEGPNQVFLSNGKKSKVKLRLHKHCKEPNKMEGHKWAYSLGFISEKDGDSLLSYYFFGLCDLHLKQDREETEG